MAMIDKNTGMTDKELQDILSVLSFTSLPKEERKSFIGIVLSILRNSMNFCLRPRVSEAQLKVFAKIDNRIILGDGCLVAFRNFAIEKKEVKNILGKKKTRYYLLNVEMCMFNKEKKYWANVINPPLYALAHNGTFLKRLQQWEDMKNSFHAMGVCLRPLAFEFNDYY
jgi:hypothetical protein